MRHLLLASCLLAGCAHRARQAPRWQMPIDRDPHLVDPSSCLGATVPDDPLAVILTDPAPTGAVDRQTYEKLRLAEEMGDHGQALALALEIAATARPFGLLLIIAREQLAIGQNATAAANAQLAAQDPNPDHARLARDLVTAAGTFGEIEVVAAPALPDLAVTIGGHRVTQWSTPIRLAPGDVEVRAFDSEGMCFVGSVALAADQHVDVYVDRGSVSFRPR